MYYSFHENLRDLLMKGLRSMKRDLVLLIVIRMLLGTPVRVVKAMMSRSKPTVVYTCQAMRVVTTAVLAVLTAQNFTRHLRWKEPCTR